MAGRCCVKRGSIAFAKAQLTMIGLLFASGASSSSSTPSSSHGNHATKWHLVTRLLGLPLIAGVLDRILIGPQRDWFTESAKKALVELHNFFNDRLYDPALEQRIGAPYRRQEALLNDRYFGKKTVVKPQDIVSPAPQRIILFGVVLALLIPAERQPFSITSVAELMADLFDWNPVRTLEGITESCG
jgi:hypothetical protein